MAVIESAWSRVAKQGVKVFWETVTTGDTGRPYKPQGVEGGIATAQVTGTFNGGTTVTLKGSNDGTNFVTLKDLQGDDISLTAAGLVDFSTAALEIRPEVASGSSDDIDVTVIFRDPQGQ